MKAPVPESLFWKVAKPATLLQKDSWQRCFPVNFSRFLRTPFVTEHLWTTASEPNSMKLHLWISEEHLFVLFYATPFLVRESFPGLKTLFWYNSAGTVSAGTVSARTRHCYAIPILLCFSDVFLHLKNVFIRHIWEVSNCTGWVKPLFWNRNETMWNFIKSLWGKTAEAQETHDVVLTL